MITPLPKTNSAKILSGLTVLVTTLAARAQTEAMPGYALINNPNLTPVYSSIFGPVGWTFQPTMDISVTALGTFNTLPLNLEVGLWNASGALLASSTITASATPVNQSLYESIAPVTLDADQTYYIAAFSPSGAFQALALSPNFAPPDGIAVTSPDIQLGTIATENNGIFQFPDNTTGAPPDSAIIAANFEFTPVPEPATFNLLGIGSLAFFARRRR